MILFNSRCTLRDNPDRFRDSFKSSLDKVANFGNTKMFQTCVIIIFALMLGNTGNPLASETMKLSEIDSGKTVEILVGDELEVMLPGNPTTGYVWEVSSLDSNLLILDKANFIAKDEAIGSGGMEILNFHAIAAGTSKVRLIFHRPFEHNVPPLKIFEMTVIIKN